MVLGSRCLGSSPLFLGLAHGSYGIGYSISPLVSEMDLILVVLGLRDISAALRKIFAVQYKKPVP